VILNRLHPVYQHLYQPLIASNTDEAKHLRRQLELIFLALGRSEMLGWTKQEEDAIHRFMAEWSRAISVFSGGG